MIDDFFKFYHNHDNGANKFLQDAYNRFDDYDTNYSLQSDMLNHASKFVGKFVAQNPQYSPEDVHRELKQKKIDIEREAFNNAGSHLNGAPDFRSMFVKEPNQISEGVDVSESSPLLRQKQERKLQNREVLQQFGIPPKQTEGNNVVNAINRFKMKKSLMLTVCDLYKSFSQGAGVSSDGIDGIAAILKNKESLSKSEIDEITSKLTNIHEQLNKKRQKKHNKKVMKELQEVEIIEEKIDESKRNILELMKKMGF